MNACTLTRLEVELRVAIREALRAGIYHTNECVQLYKEYLANGGTLLYPAIRKDEAAQIGIVLDEETDW